MFSLLTVNITAAEHQHVGIDGVSVLAQLPPAPSLTFIGDLPLPVFGGGDDHSSHVVDVPRGLLQRVQLLVVAVGLHLE